MLPLKKTLPVPAFSVRSLCSPDWLSIGALLVNVMSPATALPVSIFRPLFSVIAPLIRTLSPVVAIVNRASGPALNRMPLVITLCDPMSIAPFVFT